MSVWLVTGGTGFLGRHVLQTLASQGVPAGDVVTMGRRRPPGADPRAFFAADLEQPDSVERAVLAVKPDVVINTAGRTPPAGAEAFDRLNFRATLHLLDTLVHAGKPVRVVLVGSAAELGRVPDADLPVDEIIKVVDTVLVRPDPEPANV